MNVCCSCTIIYAMTILIDIHARLHILFQEGLLMDQLCMDRPSGNQLYNAYTKAVMSSQGY